MPIPTFKTACMSNREIAPDVWEFRLRKPQGFTFGAGQFVLFLVPLVDDPADIQTRAFSIASAPHEDDLLFVAKMKEGGRASRWIAEVIREHTPVRFQGPFGFFTFRAENPKEYFLIATGTGIAPFRAQVLDALQRAEARTIDLVFGVRSEEDLFWMEQFSTLSSHPSFHLHIALSQPSAAWRGHRGRVQVVAPQVAGSFAGKQVYVCGNPDMTMDVKRLCLGEWGMEKADVHVEGYI